MVRRHAHHHAGHLQSQGDVEVFGDVPLGPPFGFTVEGVHVADALNGFPAEEGVVSDEGGGVAGSDTVFDGGVDDVGEVGD
jgi:hypothetical protein